MIIRTVDVNNDWQMGKGKSDYASKNMAIQQNIRSRLLSWVNDCFFALNEGVDWRSRLDVGQQSNLESEVRAIILQSFGVVSITRLETIFDSTKRNYRITYDVQTIYSQALQSTIEAITGN